jgi:outer membrane receptor protein involved in Fe transport
VKGIAFFHQSVYKITGNLSLLMGLRYDHERSVMNYSYSGEMAGNSLPPADTTYPWLSDNILLPKFAVNYTIGRDMSAYLIYSTGYKAGGFNTTFERLTPGVQEMKKSFNYETVFKSSLFDKMVDMDIALFYTRLKNRRSKGTAPSGRGYLPR